LFLSSDQGGFINNIIILQNSTSPNKGTDDENTHHAIFPGRYFGREISALWQLRSPDQTSLDFFSWIFAKNYIYVLKIRNLAHLKEKKSVSY
jgi:hypothetical protein